MSGLIEFMNSTAGRALRVILGFALVSVGLVTLGGPLGAIVAIIGLVPIAMGAWGRCLLQFAFESKRG
jgi:hypothetical protein